MKNKRTIIIVCCIVIAAFILGATGILKMTNKTAQNSPEADRLIGVLITKGPLDLPEEKIYASSADEGEYVFKGIDAIRFFAPIVKANTGPYLNTNTDEGITDAKVNFKTEDDGESVTLRGTVYVASHGDIKLFHFNPVYQTSTGKVYAVRGQGIGFDNGTGLAASWTNTTEGTSSDTDIKVNIRVIDKPEKITILQYNDRNELQESTRYRPGKLPDYIDVLPDTQYIIVETVTSGGTDRKLFQNDNDFAYAFYSQDDGLCIKQEFEIGWQK